MKNILLIVDPQNDFITGSLAVEGAKEKMMKLAEYIESEGYKYDYICVTLDSHPENHMSFKENGGIWPKHCVAETNGWSIPEYLDSELIKCGKKVFYYRKGTESNTEEYSIFDNQNDGYSLYRHITHYFREGDINVDVCGIAGDYCVLETIKGLRKYIGDEYITVFPEYTASIDGGEKLTAGLGITDSDLDEIGAESYDQVDTILKEILKLKELNYTFSYIKERLLESLSIGSQIIENVLTRHFKSEFKRKQLPIKITRDEIV